MGAAAAELKVMVAERSGVIRFYEQTGHQFTPSRTVQAEHGPLTSAAWCRVDPRFVAAAIDGQWVRLFKWAPLPLLRLSQLMPRCSPHPRDASQKIQSTSVREVPPFSSTSEK